MIRILHLSDLQCGEPYRPAVGEALLRLAERVRPELTVVAGDLTQRARAGEFRTARGFLDELAGDAVVVTPGNHDVPLHRVWARLLWPYRGWTRFIDAPLDGVTRVDGLTCVALNSAAPRRGIVSGHLEAAQIEWARRAFAEAPDSDARIVVTHHHFVPTPRGHGGRPLNRARHLLEAFEEMGVDLVLGGHVHQAHLASSRALVAGPDDDPGIPLVSSGTAASSRGRGDEAGHNSVNLIRLAPDRVEVEIHRYAPDSGSFRPSATHRFRRGSDAVAAGRGVG